MGVGEDLEDHPFADHGCCDARGGGERDGAVRVEGVREDVVCPGGDEVDEF